jgi:outer membrane biosynthesis protein TonB
MSELLLRKPVSSVASTLCALALLLLAPACHKRAATTTPKVLVPSIETEPRTVPETATPYPPGPIPLPEAAPPAAPPEAAEQPTRKPSKPAARKPAPAKPESPKSEPAKAEKEKREGPAAEGGESASPAQITAEVPSAAAQSKTHNTEELLHRSEAKLAGLGRSLNESEQAMAQQARSYIDQSGEAMRAGDIERAYNLAVKASLLANELSK